MAAKYWIGRLTTVTNDWYGTREGDRVEVALFLPMQTKVPTDSCPDTHAPWFARLALKLSSFDGTGKHNPYSQVYATPNVHSNTPQLRAALQSFVLGAWDWDSGETGGFRPHRA